MQPRSWAIRIEFKLLHDPFRFNVVPRISSRSLLNEFLYNSFYLCNHDRGRHGSNSSFYNLLKVLGETDVVLEAQIRSTNSTCATTIVGEIDWSIAPKSYLRFWGFHLIYAESWLRIIYKGKLLLIMETRWTRKPRRVHAPPARPAHPTHFFPSRTSKLLSCNIKQSLKIKKPWWIRGNNANNKI